MDHAILHCVFSGLNVDSFYLLGVSVAVLVFSGMEFSIGLLIYFFFNLNNVLLPA